MCVCVSSVRWMFGLHLSSAEKPQESHLTSLSLPPTCERNVLSIPSQVPGRWCRPGPQVEPSKIRSQYVCLRARVVPRLSSPRPELKKTKAKTKAVCSRPPTCIPLGEAEFHQERSLLPTRRPGPERASRHLKVKPGAPPVGSDPHPHPGPFLAPQSFLGPDRLHVRWPASPQPLQADTKGQASRRRGREGAPGPAGLWTQAGK